MGQLSGFKYKEIVSVLKKLGFEFYRQAAGSHEIWYNPQTNRFITIPNHTDDMPEGTLRAKSYTESHGEGTELHRENLL